MWLPINIFLLKNQLMLFILIVVKEYQACSEVCIIFMLYLTLQNSIKYSIILRVPFYQKYYIIFTLVNMFAKLMVIQKTIVTSESKLC